MRNGFVYVEANPSVLATNTNGRKWLQLELTPRPDPTLFEGSGSALFFGLRAAPASEFGGYVMKVSGAARGRSHIRPFVGAPDSHARHYVALQPIARGIVALVEGNPVDGAVGVAFRVHVAQLGPDHTRIEQTALNVPRAAGAACAARVFRVAWPMIRMPAIA